MDHSASILSGPHLGLDLGLQDGSVSISVAGVYFLYAFCLLLLVNFLDQPFLLAQQALLEVEVVQAWAARVLTFHLKSWDVHRGE